jgi:HPt (histidine-containing phosphotransfer) domain-containing protein
MRNIVGSLVPIRGFDAAAGLRRATSEDRYVAFLQRFVALYGNGMRPGFEAAPRAELMRMAHRLGIACTAIGATALAAQAEALERRCRGGHDLAELSGAAFDLDEEVITLANQLRWALADLP